ncbi:MAG TPA: hypothetical protein VJU14_07075 [Solirubrobacterales bacterium]|nr:hypothetical protein [Solirubrobacterales bacterium]
MSFGSRLPILCSLVLVLLAGCGDGAEKTARPQTKPNSDVSRGLEGDRASEEVAPSHCPQGVPECRTTEGRIVYVERVDPDGDGDAHFVIADSQSITLPGLTAIDVRKGLRPHPLPGPGDLISAAGPVQTGSYGQSQIHALELHVAR